MEKEKDIERRLVKELESRGFMVLKLNVWSRKGWPDLLVCGPAGFHCFVEVKSESGRLSRLQQITMDELRNHDHLVYVTYGPDVRYLIKSIEDLSRLKTGS